MFKHQPDNINIVLPDNLRGMIDRARAEPPKPYQGAMMQAEADERNFRRDVHFPGYRRRQEYYYSPPPPRYGRRVGRERTVASWNGHRPNWRYYYY